MNEHELKKGIAFLAEAGLNLFAVLDCAALPERTEKAMLAAGVPLADYARLVLIGHGGRRLWDALQEWGMKTADPVDHYSTTITRQFIHDTLHDPPTLWLYPNTSYLVPLQQLGQLAGWSAPSPLGQGINPAYGVWFAYRTAFLTVKELPLTRLRGQSQASLCAICTDKPCIQTCPVGAVQSQHFDVDKCVKHRLETQSICADRCLARMACPFFPEHGYSLEQIQYHYRRSLVNLRAWHSRR